MTDEKEQRPRLPNGKTMTPENIERFFAQAEQGMRRAAARMLAGFLVEQGRGAEDGGYSGGFSYCDTPDPGAAPEVFYSQFVNGQCVGAMSIPRHDLQEMAMTHVIEPAYAKAQLELNAEREQVRPSLWKPGDAQ